MAKESFSFKYKNDTDHKDIKLDVGEVKVTIDNDICLTCGGVRRIVWAEYEGTKKIIKQACLLCLVDKHKHSTARNRDLS